ncbi:MAG TPA: response regulator [Pirellulales bacterium]|nr:response regulator [Pirellulales bacterium]
MAKILVVDDSAVDRHVVTGLLGKGAGLSVEAAENGAAALAMMQQSPPDLIVTDLQMPELDGLGLIKAVRVHHPRVPVILMTAHGSEELAVEALEAGAASYVPKSQLPEKLLDTVEQVLALSQANRSFEVLADCLVLCEFTLLLKNEAALIDPLVDAVQQLIERTHICDPTSRIRVGVALEEALLNAIYRGNLELGFDELQEDRAALLRGDGASLVERRRNQAPYRDRKTLVRVTITPEEARFTVRDEGPGFDVAPVAKADDPSAVVREGGRGLVLMRTFMDEVSYNAAGNEVTMVKRRTGGENGRHPGAAAE